MSTKFWAIAITVVLATIQLGLFLSLTRQWRKQRERFATLSTHRHILRLFLGAVLIPALSIFLVSFILWYGILEIGFHHTVQEAVRQSHHIARAYLDEHRRLISHNIQRIAHNFKLIFPTLRHDSKGLSHYLSEETQAQSLDAAVVFSPKGQVLIRTPFSYSLEFETIDHVFLKKAHRGVGLWINHQGKRVLGVVRLSPDAYLLVSRMVDKSILESVRKTHKASATYQSLSEHKQKIGCFLLLIVTNLTAFLLWWSLKRTMRMSSSMIEPLSSFITEVDRIRTGHFQSYLKPSSQYIPELRQLTQTFNAMVQSITKKQRSLSSINQTLKERQNFIEGVLSGVSSGVLSFDKGGNILFANRPASHISQASPLSSMAKQYPLFWSWVKTCIEKNQTLFDGKLTLGRETFRVTLCTHHPMVLTFDNMTEILDNQRNAAWSGIAKRIAHEIKNPLTPIRLATERLASLRPDDHPQTLGRYTSVILRQVDLIHSLVSEFSAFARMPSPNKQPCTFQSIIDEALFLIQQMAPLSLTIDPSLQVTKWLWDPKQMGQVFFNILKNAIQVSAMSIHIKGQKKSPYFVISVMDNGPGWPKEKHHLTDPYVTGHDQGTGLGLAIVKKIVEDHQGYLVLKDRDDKLVGAQLDIYLPHKDIILP